MTKQIEEFVRQKVLRMLQIDPSAAAAAVRSFVASEADEKDSCCILADPSRSLQIAIDRYAGQRDILYCQHPVIKNLSFRLLRDYRCRYTFDSKHQLTDHDIKLHVLVRWHFLSGSMANLANLYMNMAAYDADHVSDELLIMLCDFTLQDVIAAMVQIYAISPRFYWAVWTRDDAAIEDCLIEFKDSLPALNCFRYRSDPADKIRLLVGAIFEFEHGYELICALTSTTSPSVSSLRATMTSPQAYAAAVHGSGATARYLNGTWLHHIPFQLHLQHKAAAMKANHAWQQYSQRGNRSWRGQKGAMADVKMFKVNRIAHTLVPPMGLRDFRVKNVNGLAPAHSLFGFDPVRVAIALVLSIAHHLPKHAGGNNVGSGLKRGFERPDFYSAVGRLALNILAHASPRTAQDIFDESIRRASKRTLADTQAVQRISSVGLPALMCNPEGWTVALGTNQTVYYPSVIAEASLKLGSGAFENIVRSTKDYYRNLTISRGAAPAKAKIDDALRFRPQAWFEKKAQIAQMRRARSKVPTEYLKTFPQLFPQNPAHIDDFAFECAAEFWPALTPLAEDPIYRRTPDPLNNITKLISGLPATRSAGQSVDLDETDNHECAPCCVMADIDESEDVDAELW